MYIARCLQAHVRALHTDFERFPLHFLRKFKQIVITGYFGNFVDDMSHKLE